MTPYQIHNEDCIGGMKRGRPGADHTAGFVRLQRGEALIVDTREKAMAVLQYARLHRLAAAMFKLHGTGWGVLKWKRRVLARCPKCGYRRSNPSARET